MKTAPPAPGKHYRAHGRVSAAGIAFLGSLALLLVMGVLLFRQRGREIAPATGPGTAPSTGPLKLYCAAGLRPPVDATIKDYAAAYGIEVTVNYAGSNTLLSNLQIAGDGDLYIAADDRYLDQARKKDLIAETLPLARMTPELAVAKGNPKNLHSVDDLLKAGDLKIAQAQPDAAAIGKITRDVLTKTGQWDALAKRTTTFTGTVNQAVESVQVGGVDAAFGWDCLAQQYPKLDMVPLREFEGQSSKVDVAVLKGSRNAPAALRFARFLAARDKGLTNFKRFGYTPADGDAWGDVPEIHLLGGAMLRPAITQTVRDFERREGARVVTVYNGCGILVSQMRAGEHPDIYFACDTSFMRQVKDLFDQPHDVSQNQLVVIVPKANPFHVRTLKDLAQPNVRVGVGHEKQCALGALTEQTLIQGGLADAIRKNIATKSPTGDFLVNQLRAGGLDAVVAYLSNAAGARDELLCISIDIPCAIATQPIAVGRESDHKQLTERLVAALRSDESKQRFEGEGFTWK